MSLEILRNAALSYADECAELRKRLASAEQTEKHLLQRLAEQCAATARLAESCRELGLVPCMCGRVYAVSRSILHRDDKPVWRDLRFVGEQKIPADADGPALVLELRDCACGSTISREVR